MKKLLCSVMLGLTSALTFGGISPTGLLHISDLSVNKGENMITVDMTVNPQQYKVSNNKMLRLSPMLASATDTITLPSVDIAGRHAWIEELRNNNGKAEGRATLMRAGSKDAFHYSRTIPFEGAFENSSLLVKVDTLSICRCGDEGMLSKPFTIAEMDFRPRQFNADFLYKAPTDSAEKIFNLSGRANIIFKVNRTEIDWSYAGNHAELDSILQSVNAVRDNPDATVKEIFLTGYASPEGSYANNVRLAKGRTEAVRDYVAKNASFPSSVYHTARVPEDWEGLREWIAASEMPSKEAMLAFIADKSISPEDKNDPFKARFPEEYPFLLATVYPTLRHTDYRITYSIRKYYDINEIRKVMETNPRNLSENELFLLANSLEPGSQEYDEVFELAARLYPSNITANLNAANSAMNRGRLDEAEKYLSRAGNGPETTYAKGILYALKKDYTKAEQAFKEAEKAGIPQAATSLEEINRIKEFDGEVRVF